jgi:hypothetical protein
MASALHPQQVIGQDMSAYQIVLQMRRAAAFAALDTVFWRVLLV